MGIVTFAGYVYSNFDLRVGITIFFSVCWSKNTEIIFGGRSIKFSTIYFKILLSGISEDYFSLLFPIAILLWENSYSTDEIFVTISSTTFFRKLISSDLVERGVINSGTLKFRLLLELPN